jgi:hypothetical protein
MKEIVSIVEGKPAMKVLCTIPFRDKTITELDVSKKGLGAEGALVVGRYLEGNRALTALNVSENSIGEIVFPEGWSSEFDRGEECYVFTHVDGRQQKEVPEGSSPFGAIALADGLRNNEALVSLDISENILAPVLAKADEKIQCLGSPDALFTGCTLLTPFFLCVFAGRN